MRVRTYEVATASGRHFVVARRWWHPKDRRAARLAAKVLSHMEPRLEREARAMALRAVYGFDLFRVP